jgi:type VI secretion system protein ImpE
LATADDLLRGGDLDGARQALVEIVRARPADAEARMFLFQLLALLGEWDKARRQLDTLAQLSPEASMLAAAYGQAIDAEGVRAAFFNDGGGEVHIHGSGQGGGSPWLTDLAESLSHFATGNADAGDAARERAFEAAPDRPGTIDGTAFDWLADADGRFGPALEAIIGGRWGIVGFDQIASIKSTGARDLRDIIWYPVQIMFTAGQSVAAMLPARYPLSEASPDPMVRLARTTTWHDAPSGEAGLGQRLLGLSDGDERGLIGVREIVFS